MNWYNLQIHCLEILLLGDMFKLVLCFALTLCLASKNDLAYQSRQIIALPNELQQLQKRFPYGMVTTTTQLNAMSRHEVFYGEETICKSVSYSIVC